MTVTLENPPEQCQSLVNALDQLPESDPLHAELAAIAAKTALEVGHAFRRSSLRSDFLRAQPPMKQHRICTAFVVSSAVVVGMRGVE